MVVAASPKSAECMYAEELLKIMFWDGRGVRAHIPPVPLLYPPTTKIDLATGPGSPEYDKVSSRVQKMQKDLKVCFCPGLC